MNFKIYIPLWLNIKAGTGLAVLDNMLEFTFHSG